LFDDLDITFQDADVEDLQFRIADLRESARTGLDEVVPADPIATDEQRAELLFFLGWGKLLAGELFVALPEVGAGVPLAPTENLQSAVQDFLAAEAIAPDNAGYKLALARAYYYLGDQANAVQKAQEALTADPAFTRNVQFDGVNQPDNDFADALFDRGNFDDLQPLPRLDFLDPKYFVSGTDESPVYIQKAEEAHMIIAEGSLADGDLSGAQAAMLNLVGLVNSRSTATFSDAVEDREDRPASPSVMVQASAADPLIGGLVLDRQAGNVTIPVISGTSVTDAQVNALADVIAALELLYLMRQEVFIAEGRRFVDMGIKIPIHENEMLLNSSVEASHLEPFIPSFMPSDLDGFTFDEGAGTVTITVNMNKVLVDNRTDTSVVPFF
ncbi:MAG: tetratricopeptide repeat protein, partial [Cyclobacteriaceae bacterium]